MAMLNNQRDSLPNSWPHISSAPAERALLQAISDAKRRPQSGFQCGKSRNSAPLAMKKSWLSIWRNLSSKHGTSSQIIKMGDFAMDVPMVFPDMLMDAVWWDYWWMGIEWFSVDVVGESKGPSSRTAENGVYILYYILYIHIYVYSIWLVVSTNPSEKNLNQVGVLFLKYGKITHVPNHQAAILEATSQVIALVGPHLQQIPIINPSKVGSSMRCFNALVDSPCFVCV